MEIGRPQGGFRCPEGQCVAGVGAGGGGKTQVTVKNNNTEDYI